MQIIPNNQFVNIQLFRLGRFKTNNNRPIRVILEDANLIHIVIKSSSAIRKVCGHISASFHRTPREI